MKNNYFKKYRENTIFSNISVDYLGNKKNIIYADWCGSGKVYKPIEDEIMIKYAPYYSNLHSTGNAAADFMEKEYKESKEVIKQHFGADRDYSLILNGQGMTTAMNQCIDIIKDNILKPSETLVLVSPYEHNSNYITWIQRGYELKVLQLDESGAIDLDCYESILKKNISKKIIVSITACSNVVGILLDIKVITELAKRYNAYVFVDYTACAPYTEINMKRIGIDVLVCSMHKFLGGVQGVGVLLIKNILYKRQIPSKVGGGTVKWVGLNGRIKYWNDIEKREEAGTVPVLQTIRSRLAIELKEEIGIENIIERERKVTNVFLHKIRGIEKIKLFMPNVDNRLPVFSFNVLGMGYSQVIKKLNDTYSIQARGGCCCASLFAHYVMGMSEKVSKSHYEKILADPNYDPNMGWVRISMNYLTSDQEIEMIEESLNSI